MIEIAIKKKVSKSVTEIEYVKETMQIPYWMAHRNCIFCLFDLNVNSQIIAFQYDLCSIGHAHNDCFNASMTKAGEIEQERLKK